MIHFHAQDTEGMIFLLEIQIFNFFVDGEMVWRYCDDCIFVSGV